MVLKRDFVWLFTTWGVVTGCNLYKPFHIDDVAHLIISSWIAIAPLHPMSGPINWSGTTEHIYDTNQPHLYFYVLAGWGRLFGYSEFALHVMQSLFSAICIALFYFIARRLSNNNALWLTTMLALNPAFIVSQNIMVDVPLLCCWLGVFACMLCGINSPHQHCRFAFSSAICAAAILIKYSSFVLIPVLLTSLILERRLRQAWCLAIPIVVLAAWVAFNLYDYGGIHLMTAFNSAARNYKQAAMYHEYFPMLYNIYGFSSIMKIIHFSLSWVIGAGAFSCFGFIAAAQMVPRFANAIYVVCFSCLVALVMAVLTKILPSRPSDMILTLGFLVSGILMLPFILKPRRDLSLIYLQAWIIFTTFFYIISAPFIAARHVLLILPAIFLLITVTRKIPRNAKCFGLVITITLSIGLSVSDFRFAEFYKSEATTIKASFPADATIWAAGHWGWQYYATKSGMNEIDIGTGLLKAASECQEKTGIDPESITFLEGDPLTRLPQLCANLSIPYPGASLIHAGDYLIVPYQVDYQLPTYIQIKPVRNDSYNGSAYDPFCTSRPVRFYAFSGWYGPWSISTECDQSIGIFQVIR